MKFNVDDKQDQLNKLKAYYQQNFRTVEEKILITNTIDKINTNEEFFGFDKSGKPSWKQIFDFVFLDKESEYKKRFLEHFYKI